jgi:hypothetical protein
VKRLGKETILNALYGNSLYSLGSGIRTNKSAEWVRKILLKLQAKRNHISSPVFSNGCHLMFLDVAIIIQHVKRTQSLRRHPENVADRMVSQPLSLVARECKNYPNSCRQWMLN